jgi:peptidyl-prolyl cis-trans isomerase SurA
LEKAREFGLEVTESEIDTYIENIKTANQWTQEDLVSQLKEEGLALEVFRKRVKEDMERNRLIEYEVQGKTIVRDDQIINYYQEHKDDFKEEGQVDIASIFLMKSGRDDPAEDMELNKKGEHILSRLEQGEDFGTLAKEFSEGPGADEGGNLGSFKTSMIDKELLDILDSLPEGGVSDLIDRENALQIIKLVKKDEEAIIPFEEVKDEIYDVLYQEEINRRYTSWIEEMREDSFIKIIF